MEEEKLEKENKKKDKRKILGILVIIGLIIDIILLIIFLIYKNNKKPSTDVDSSSSSIEEQYIEEAQTFKNKLLTLMNTSIDVDLEKTNSQFDMNNIISVSTDTSNHVLFTGYNDNYVSTMTISLSNLNNFIDDINNDNYGATSISLFDMDKVSLNPLLEDNDFNDGHKKNIKYVLATNNATHRSISSSYFDDNDNTYYSITNYQYEIGEFHYLNITDDNKTGYTLEDNPVIYYLLK